MARIGQQGVGVGGNYVNSVVMEFENEAVWSHKMVQNAVTCLLKTSQNSYLADFRGVLSNNITAV